MNEKARKIKSFIIMSKKEQKFEYDDNRMIINMEINDHEIFLDKFSRYDYPIISTEIAEYLEKVTTSIKPNERFTLRIYSDCIDDYEKNIYTMAIKNYYIDKYIVKNRELKNYRRLSFILGFIGILVLTFVIILEYSEKSVLWMRVFDIVAWVFIWEAVDIFFFKCKELRLNQMRNLNFIDMEIEYI